MIKNSNLILSGVIVVLLVIIYLLVPGKQVVESSGANDSGVGDTEVTQEIRQLNDNILQLTDTVNRMSRQLASGDHSGVDHFQADADADQAAENNPDNRDRFDQQATREQQNAARLSLLNSLDNPNMTLTDITGSPQMKHLPKSMQNDIMQEIARKINAGEIDKRHFIPGYKPD